MLKSILSRRKKAQSATEYMMTYGWAFVIIALAAGMLYYFVTVPQTVSQNTCVFQQSVLCTDIILDYNATSGNTIAYFELTNQNDYGIANVVAIVNVKGYNSSATGCSALTYIIGPGNSILCTVTLSNSVSANLNNFLSGTIYLSAYNCGLLPNYLTTHSCASAPVQTVFGSYSGHVEQQIPSFLSCVNNPKSLTNTNEYVCYTQNTQLTGDIQAFNIYIKPGVTVTTGGYSMLAWTNITNKGTIKAGPGPTGGTPWPAGGGNIFHGAGSYGVFLQANIITAGTINAGGWYGDNGLSTASGQGGGGGGALLLVYGPNGYTAGTYNTSGGNGGGENTFGTSGSGFGGTGGSTRSGGGQPGQSGGICNAGSQWNGCTGQTPAAPSAATILANLASWYNGGIQTRIEGGGGGGGGEGLTNGNANGNIGSGAGTSYGGSGGGGGGWSGLNLNGFGGAGGSGPIITYQYTVPPVTLATPTIP